MCPSKSSWGFLSMGSFPFAAKRGLNEHVVGICDGPTFTSIERLEVVLVDEAFLLPCAGVTKRWDVEVVSDGLKREGTVHLEPLGSLAPLREDDVAVGEEWHVA